MKNHITRAQRLALLFIAAVSLMSGKISPSADANRSTASAHAAQGAPCFQCVPGEGGQFFSIPDKEIKVTIMPSETAPGVTSLIFLSSPGPRTFIGTNRDVGKTVCLGPFPTSVELIFEIIPTGTLPDGMPILSVSYFSGPGSRNVATDGLTHAKVECLSGNQAGKATVGFEDLPGPPPGSDRDFNDVQIELSCCEAAKCNLFSFHSPQYFLNRLDRLPRTAVLIGGVNFNAPVSTANIEAIRSALQGGSLFGNVPTGSPLQQLNREFVAAQLSLALAGGDGSPAAYNALWSNLGCPGLFGSFAPIRLTNGVELTVDSMLKDLFIQAQAAIRENRTLDMVLLTNLFSAIICPTCPKINLPDLAVETSCVRINSNPRFVKLTITVFNVGDVTAPSGISIRVVDAGGVFSTLGFTTGALLPVSGSETLTFDVLKSPGCPPELLLCPLAVIINDVTPISEKTTLNNIKFTTCP